MKFEHVIIALLTIAVAVLASVMVCSRTKPKQPDWLFLVNSTGATVSPPRSGAITITLPNMKSVAFTDRPFHRVLPLKNDRALADILRKMIEVEQNPPNASVVGQDMKTAVVEIVRVTDSKGTIELTCKVLNGSLKPGTHPFLSITIDNFFGAIGNWVSGAATTVAHTVTHVVTHPFCSACELFIKAPLALMNGQGCEAILPESPEIIAECVAAAAPMDEEGVGEVIQATICPALPETMSVACEAAMERGESNWEEAVEKIICHEKLKLC